MDPVTVTVQDAVHVMGLGRTTIYELIGQGKLKTIKIGRRRLITTDSIRALVASA